jgi:hypothetical protein
MYVSFFEGGSGLVLEVGNVMLMQVSSKLQVPQVGVSVSAIWKELSWRREPIYVHITQHWKVKL